MITLKKSEERRHLRTGGRETWKTFDPDRQNDPLREGFRMLKSLDEEGLAPGKGFLLQAPKDMEVFTYVREGTLTREDPSGKLSVLDAGECHRAGARSGAKHPAVNTSLTGDAQAFQCCFALDRKKVSPSAEQKRFSVAERKG